MRLRILTAEQLAEGYVRLAGIAEDGVKTLRDRFQVVERYPDGRALVVEPTEGDPMLRHLWSRDGHSLR